MRRLWAVAAALLLVSGCSTTAADLPLPGSSMPGTTYDVTAELPDALNLADGAPVKLDGVTVGRVSTVTVRDFTARVVISVSESTPLHEGALLRLRSTTPLGELFVEVSDSDTGPRLTDGDRISAEDTSTAPTVEDALAATSMLVNGGGLGQLQTIVREANEVVGGREQTVRDLMSRLATTTRTVNDSSDDIDATLEALADVSETLRRRDRTIDRALTDVAPAASVLSRNTDGLAELLSSIDELSVSTTRVVREVRADLLSTLRQVGPVFDQLASLDGELGPGLDDLVGFATLIDRAVPGDYLNTSLFFQDTVSLGLPALPFVEAPAPDAPGGPDAPSIVLTPPGSLQELLESPPVLNDLGLGALLGGSS